MSIPFGIKIILCGFLLCVGLSAVACSQKKEEAVDVKTLMEDRCSVCHFSTNIYNVVKSPAEWEMTVQRMWRLNPDLMSDKESDLITAYLKEEASKQKANLAER